MYQNWDWENRAVTTDEISMWIEKIWGMLWSWQKKREKYDKDVIKRKSDKYLSDQMWAAMRKNLKDSYYFYLKETEQEKRETQAILNQKNLKE